VTSTAGNTLERPAQLAQSDAETELARFFQIGLYYTQLTGQMAKMPSCPVDTAWHNLIESTGDPLVTGYAAQVLSPGIGIEHVASGGVDPIDWIPLYEKVYGALPQIWFQNVDGTVNDELITAYLAGLVTRMSWDCGPAYKAIDGAPGLLEMSWDCGPAYQKLATVGS
jgi:hypothetical protein